MPTPKKIEDEPKIQAEDVAEAVAETAVEAAQKAVDPIPKLVPRDTRLPSARPVVSASHKRRHLFVELPAGTQPEELMDPRYWTHHAREFTPMDRVEVFCEDGLWEAEFRVLFVGTQEVRMTPITITRHDAVEGATGPYVVEWISTSKRWGIRRSDNNEVVKDGFFSQSAAHAFASQRLAEMRS